MCDVTRGICFVLHFFRHEIIPLSCCKPCLISCCEGPGGPEDPEISEEYGLGLVTDSASE